VDITCIKIALNKDGEKLYLDPEQIIPIQDAGDYQIRLTAKKQEETATSNEEAARYKLRYRFWERALPVLREKTGIYINVSPTKDNWVYGGSGYGGIAYSAIVRMNGARAELYIATNDREKNKYIFNELKKRHSEVITNDGFTFDWRELPDRKSSCISIHYNDYGLANEDNWEAVIKFLADGVTSLIKSFKPLLDEIVCD
jgi:hypothetical protein